MTLIGPWTGRIGHLPIYTSSYIVYVLHAFVSTVHGTRFRRLRLVGAGQQPASSRPAAGCRKHGRSGEFEQTCRAVRRLLLCPATQRARRRRHRLGKTGTVLEQERRKRFRAVLLCLSSPPRRGPPNGGKHMRGNARVGASQLRVRQVSLTLRLICGYFLRSLQPFLTCIYETLLDI